MGIFDSISQDPLQPGSAGQPAGTSAQQPTTATQSPNLLAAPGTPGAQSPGGVSTPGVMANSTTGQGQANPTDQDPLARAKALMAQGVISSDQFAQMQQQLGGGQPSPAVPPPAQVPNGNYGFAAPTTGTDPLAAQRLQMQNGTISDADFEAAQQKYNASLSGGTAAPVNMGNSLFQAGFQQPA